jgi:hypothetical protein
LLTCNKPITNNFLPCCGTDIRETAGAVLVHTSLCTAPLLGGGSGQLLAELKPRQRGNDPEPIKRRFGVWGKAEC